jgi:hypothetical protein
MMNSTAALKRDRDRSQPEMNSRSARYRSEIEAREIIRFDFDRRRRGLIMHPLILFLQERFFPKRQSRSSLHNINESVCVFSQKRLKNKSIQSCGKPLRKNREKPENGSYNPNAPSLVYRF